MLAVQHKGVRMFLSKEFKEKHNIVGVGFPCSPELDKAINDLLARAVPNVEPSLPIRKERKTYEIFRDYLADHSKDMSPDELDAFRVVIADLKAGADVEEFEERFIDEICEA